MPRDSAKEYEKFLKEFEPIRHRCIKTIRATLENQRIEREKRHRCPDKE